MENVVVVIGPGQIGQAIARRVRVGKHIVLADRSEANANAAAEVMSNAGYQVSVATVDVSSREAVHALVDKASFPRDKTCGDGLTTAALRLIEQLGVDLRTLPGYMAVRETVLVGPDGRRVSLPLATDGDHAAVVPRVELDAAIVDTARRSGVEVRDGVAVSGIDMNGDGEAVTATTAEGDSVRARFLIAADGHYSFVRRCLRPPAPPELGTWHAFRQYFRGVDDPRLYVLFEADLLPGYAWVFPLPEGRASSPPSGPEPGRGEGCGEPTRSPPRHPFRRRTRGPHGSRSSR